MTRPVAKQFRVLQGFGNTSFVKKHRDWYEAFGGIHSGLDFDVPPGTEVSAALPGYVVRRYFHPGIGKHLAIRTGNILAFYAHLSKYSVKIGEHIKEGDCIGLSGATGQALSEPHLHFEVRDLTQKTLGARVFKPIFKPGYPPQFQSEFSYKIYDRKNLSDLALKFFGRRAAWPRLTKRNPALRNHNSGWILKLGTKIKVPQKISQASLALMS